MLILRSTWLLLKASTRVLMEGVPAHLSYDEIGGALTRVPGVSAVHDLHIWHMTSERAALSAHQTRVHPDCTLELDLASGKAANRVAGLLGVPDLRRNPSELGLVRA